MLTPLAGSLGPLGRARALIDPATVAGLLAWYKADSLALSDGAAVVTWTDSSGNGFTASQATGSRQPTYKAAIQHGLPVVRWDGTRFLTLAGVPALAAGAYTILAVAQSSTTGTLFSEARASSGVPFLNLFHISTGKRRWNQRDDAGVEVSGGTFDVAAANGAWHLQTVQRTGTSWQQSVDNGVSSTVTATLGVTTLDAAMLGSTARLAPSIAFTGDIGEILIYNLAVAAGDLARLKTYLNARWGLY